MINLLVNIKPGLVDVLMLKCDDNYNDDFDKEIYEECIFRAYKKVARLYNIVTYLLSFENTISVPLNPPDNFLTEEKAKDIDLPINYFRGEIKVMVNGTTFDKAQNHEMKENQYHLYRGVNSWKFNYTPRGVNDVVDIYFQGDLEVEAFEDERTMPIIPNKYEDEVIKYALKELGEIGSARFKGEKREKYFGILMRNSERGIDPNITENIDFKMKPLRYP